MTTFDQLAASNGIFDRAALMPRPPRRTPSGGGPGLVLTQRATSASVHPQLPDTPVWAYENHLPGPVVVVDAGDVLQVRHRNRVAGTMPYRHVVVTSGIGSMNETGTAGEVLTGPDADNSAAIAALSARTVVHLHGAPSNPDGDGWPENVLSSGSSRTVEYTFPREKWTMAGADGVSRTFQSGAGPAYWYHDHGMGVTRLNVYAGLAGAWIVRDPIEFALGLPTHSARELPLVLMDRNLDTVDGTATGDLTGSLLHKVETAVRECFAPVNLVNGLAWPRCEVHPSVHRLRLVNGCNARTYRLHFLAMTSATDLSPTPVDPALVQQIGTDGGLLGTAVNLPADGLVLSPGERADVLIDFGELALAGVTHVAVYNNAPAPFGGLPPGPADAITGSDPGGFRAVPQVMRFDLLGTSPHTGLRGRPIAGMALDPDFRHIPLDHTKLPTDHGHTVVALREEEEIVRDAHGQPIVDGAGALLTRLMLFAHELMPEDDATAMGMNMHAATMEAVDPVTGAIVPVPAGVRIGLPGDPHSPYVTIGKRFYDSVGTMITQGAWHLWKVINISPDTHPFHIHLTQFQVSARTELVSDQAGTGGTPSDATEFTFVSENPGVIDDNETGWKDTARVNPGGRGPGDEVITAEMVTVLGCFERHAGRYLYHCHILEHEDTEMMRPFTVLPADVLAVMGMPGH
jgi:FtsP/CotA-like multicopper oxidase with cupredoxin domain